MKTPSDEEYLLHRGGRPTLADLLDALEFSPSRGTIGLNGARMVLSRATFGADLQDQLVHRFGEHEARVLMMRLGYRNGREDAEFIRQQWPNLDIGDAFTAGTRLHMLTGTVRVETLHNDFDFRSDRFSGDFLWHQSVEATEYQRRHGRALAPVCWAQTGYAAGYASVFFRKLVLYKEVSCAAMGDKACRVVGKTVDGWGEDDPFVRMFLDEVLPTRAEMPTRHKRGERARVGVDFSASETLVIAPLRAELEMLVRGRLHAVITGPEGAGRRVAAEWLHRARFPHGKLHRCHAGSPQVPELLERLRKGAAAAGGRGQTLILDDIEALPQAHQSTVIDLLRPGEPVADTVLIIGLSHQPLHRLRRDGTLQAELIYPLSVLPLAMPPLSSRRAEIPALAAQILTQMVSTDADAAPVTLNDEACEALKQAPWPGNLPELRATLQRAVLCAMTPPMLTRDDIVAALSTPPREGATVTGTGWEGDDFAALWDQLQPLFVAGIGMDTLISWIEEQALSEAGGNISAAARLLGVSRPKLDYRLKTKG